VSSALPSVTWRDYPAAGSLHEPQQTPRSRRAARLLLHPLSAVCLIQTALSLSIVWSNTAFADEAQYLTSGRYEWAHWLHGTDVPPYLTSTLSGSPVLYPPLGALADSVAGLAGARILSLLFMVGTTILLYQIAAKLWDPAAALIAAALWALSEPVIRLAFATFDPLSVLLVALSAWLAIQASYRRRPLVFVIAPAAALAAADATAYSGTIIDPVIVAFAFLVWLPVFRLRLALLYTGLLAGVLVVIFILLMTASGSWTGLMTTVIDRSGSDHQGILLVLNDSWEYSGLIAVLAIIGVITAFGAETRNRALLMALLGGTALLVPAAQLREQTAWSLDKHLAYGIFFAAIAAGYGCSTLIHWLPGLRRELAAFFCAIALIYPMATSWQSAWNVYHSWPNASSFISAFKLSAEQQHGLIDISQIGPQNIAEYYTAQGRNWRRWSTSLSLNPAGIPQKSWTSYYESRLRSGKYGIIALFYATTFSSAPDLPGSFILSPPSKGANQQLLRYVGQNAGEPGLPALTLALEEDHDYKRTATGPYNSAHEHGVFAIWQAKAQT
jgi:4-amino-4-deoxy-L-arabinose transferase-like glycosyltransferase